MGRADLGKGRGGVSRHQWRRVLAEVGLVAGAAGRHSAPAAAVGDRLHRYRRTHPERHEPHRARGLRHLDTWSGLGLGLGFQLGLGLGLGLTLTLTSIPISAA